MAIGDASCWRGPHTGVEQPKETAPRFNLIAAEILERAAKKLRANQSMEAVAGDLLPILEVMARRL